MQRNLLRLAPRWFEENRPSEIASRLTSDTAVVEIVIGTTLSVAIRNLLVGAGGERSYRGRVRMIRSDPTFTPYYALTGKDAARLSYLAEVQLQGAGVGDLPAGLPLRVRFDGRH